MPLFLRPGIFAIVALLLLASAAEARPRPRQASNFQSNKTFGLGLMLGAPSGLSGKYFVASDAAFDFGVGALSFRGRDGLHLHFDYLWHPVNLAEAEPFWLPLYFGVGARVFDYTRRERDDFAVGVRAPIGIAMDFNNVPLDIFFELAFVLDFIVDESGADADFNGAIGIRYWFE